MGIWTDYLRMLDRCGKDLHNAHYVCPADLKAEHDFVGRPTEIQILRVVYKILEVAFASAFEYRFHTAVRQQSFHQLLRGDVGERTLQTIAS